ncbi:DUF3574 domain-containing protein [Roseiterribacter gracilis]|uniref:DUF3574 domain-containing protein n=1 Tax=Roseiterribacter gracilis TaxID=2812848 RepID=A0A8S8XG21_9PROT|nr:hypothetical protein TMPK1_24230 [Rhodospirillales bacterium TMPK1]
MRALLLLLLLGGCASAPMCQKPTEPQLVAQLFFGREIPGGGAIGEAAFERFVDEEITPRFPDGFTLSAATGRWRDAQTRQTIREPSTLLLVVAPDEPATRARLDAIAASYKTRFRQDAVGQVLTRGCAAF